MELNTYLQYRPYNLQTLKNVSNKVTFSALPVKNAVSSCERVIEGKSIPYLYNTISSNIRKIVTSNEFLKEKIIELNKDGSKNITLKPADFDFSGVSIKYKKYCARDVNNIELSYIDEFGKSKGIDIDELTCGCLKETLSMQRQSDQNDNAVNIAVALLTSPEKILETVKSKDELLLGINKIKSLLISECIPA